MMELWEDYFEWEKRLRMMGCGAEETRQDRETRKEVRIQFRIFCSHRHDAITITVFVIIVLDQRETFKDTISVTAILKEPKVKTLW